ncbi:MAG TPA: hypothetical protein EYO31_06240, partial [Phycisphaerales bacterium]|nr:hypothetical protein [Phycisphaerales bacterium]
MVEAASGNKLMQLIDANLVVKGLAPMPDIRVRTKYWMRIGGMFVVFFIFCQLLVTFAVIPIWLYRGVLFCMSLLWPYVVIGMMPASVDPSMPPMYRFIRKWIPQTQWCWAIGYVVWFVFHVSTTAGTLSGNLGHFFPIIALHAVAGIGLIGLLFWLHDLALRLDLHTAAHQCNLVAILMATWGVVVFVLPWKHFAAANLSAEQGAIMWWVYIVLLMLPWLWVLHLFARALFEFASYSGWSLRHEQGLVGRHDRIRKKAEAFDKEH